MSEHLVEEVKNADSGLNQTPQWAKESIGKKLKSEDRADPKVDTLEKGVRISLLSSKETIATCNFWIGLCKAGPHRPHSLLDISDIESLLTTAATEGIRDPGPIMLTDTRTHPARFIYLLPQPEAMEDEDARAHWVAKLSATLKSWAPENIGLYISPDLLPHAQGFTLLRDTLKQLILQSEKRQYSLLLGSHDMNSILNSALSLRDDLSEQSINLSVYH